MTGLISRETALKAIEEICFALWEIDIPSPTVPEYIEHHEQVQRVMALAEKWGRELRDVPDVRPTLYGYEIEHLAYIARVMEKEGITAEEAVRTFGDISRAVGMIIEEVQQKVEEMLYEQAGVQAGVPAPQTGDGGGDKQEGPAEGGGDLQAEAIRSSERPAETEENR